MIAAIADDFTGATDVAVAFRRAGLRVQLVFGVPDEVSGSPRGASNTGDSAAGFAIGTSDALVIALKSRTIPANDAVDQSVRSARWALAHGFDQIYVKYCSTFDSSARGNIGPVCDALADLTGAGLTVVTPASPLHDRSVFEGHLFAGGQLLSDSPMRHHPLTPMTDSIIARILDSQTDRAIGHVRHATVRLSATRSSTVSPLDRELQDLRGAGIRYAVVDAIDDDDLVTIGRACRSHPLVTGAAGPAGGLARALVDHDPDHANSGLTDAKPTDAGSPGPGGPTVVLAGSCSARTLEQVAFMAETNPSYRLDAVDTPDPEALARGALAWYDALGSSAGAPVIHSSLPPAELQAVQRALGVEFAAELVEHALGAIARGLVERGAGRIVVAGGETSGSVTTALGVRQGRVGEEAAPGVPWIHVEGARPLDLLLKSGNFGAVDFLANVSTSAGASTGSTHER